jgi:hypothetical protein
VSSSPFTRAQMTSRRRVAAVQKAAAMCAPLFARQGVEVADPYNCGSYGCVYPAGPGRVAKLSFDAGEAELALLFAQARGAHPALPIIHYVGSAPPKCGTHGERKPAPLYIVVREDLQDVALFIEVEGKKPLDRALMNIDEFPYEDFAPKMEHAMESLRAFPKALAVYAQAIDFAAWAMEHEIFLGDMHLDNWGVRGGKQLVLRDFGLSSSDSAPPASSVPVLNGAVLRGAMRSLRGLARHRLVIRGVKRRR